MSDREQLLERYENAQFALLMGDFAAEIGDALQSMNVNLRQSQPEMVSDSALQRCFTTIQKAFRLARRKRRRVSAVKVLKLLPIAVVISAALLLLASAAFPKFRAGIYNVFRTDRREATEWSISSEPEAAQTIEADAMFSVDLPPNFEMTYLYQSMMYSYADYQNMKDTSQMIHVEIIYGEGASVSIDNERQTREYSVDVNGFEALLRANDYESTIIWTDISVPCIVLIEADHVDDDTLICLARSLNYDQLQLSDPSH